MTLRDLALILKPFDARLRGLIGRGLLRLIKEADDGSYLIQMTRRAGEVSDEIPLTQPYGFAYKPTPANGAGTGETIVVQIGGDLNNLAALVVADKTGRPTLADGEVAVYHRSGAVVHLKANGDIALIPTGKALIGAAGASKKSSREGDGVVIDSTTDSSFLTWLGGVTTFINGLAPGTLQPVSTIAAKINAGSNTVRVAD